MKEEISKAMDAHTLWRDKLLTVIDTGKTETPIDIIKTDNNCAFGKWIYSNEITDEMKKSKIYHDIKEYHAKFHIEAARIAELALNGNKDMATSLLQNDGTYNDLSKNLMQLLIKWRKDAA
jgi:hypothetical protein